MLLKDFPPDPAVSDLVQCYRICHFAFDRSATVPAKAYPPKPETILHFFLRDSWAYQPATGPKQFQPPIVLIGQRTFVTRQYTGSDFLNFQVVFQPAALFRLTGIPAYELANQILNAEDLFPTTIRLTFEQLQAATSYAEMLKIGERFVQTLLKRTIRGFHAVDTVAGHLLHTDVKFSLDCLADQSCLSSKQFKRKFYERTGINPKLYARIIRFTKAFNLKNRYPDRDWLGIAVQSGYYDYQHLVKDYQDFTGLTPAAFHVLEQSSPEYILGLTPELYRSRMALG